MGYLRCVPIVSDSGLHDIAQLAPSDFCILNLVLKLFQKSEKGSYHKYCDVSMGAHLEAERTHQ